MNRRTWIRIAVVLALVLVVTLGVSAQGKGGAKGQKLGLVFNVTNLLMDVGTASDGLIGGLGLKYWLGDKAALRGILEFSYAADSAADTSSTLFGLSAAFEYHFVRAKVSPYVGGLAGLEVATATGTPSDFGFYVGPILGAEVSLLDYLGLFAEYILLLRMNEPNFFLDLTIGNAASIGLIIYLP
jgi:hypothetical protein